MMKKIMVTRKIVKSRVSGFSRSKLETGRLMHSYKSSPKVVTVFSRPS